MPAADPIVSLPKTQLAVVVQGPGKVSLESNVPVPVVQPGMVLVKVAAVAINPADAKMLDYSAAPGAITGYDFAGTVVAVGDEVSRVSVGDRVSGFVHGMNKLIPQVGAFCEYVGAYADLMLKIPDDMSFEQGASLGIGIATASLTLFSELGLPVGVGELRKGEPVTAEDREEREVVLVAGGATATGTQAIQLLKLAGLRPIATSSPANFDLCMRYGAEKVFDYRSPTCAQDIKEYTKNELAYTLDCVTQVDTTQLCYSAMGRAGGRYVALEPFRDTITQSRALTIEASWIMVLTVFGGKVALEGEYGREARPEDRKFAVEVFETVQSLLDRGLIESHPIKLMPGKWDGVVEAVDIIRNQAQSANKLVYSVA